MKRSTLVLGELQENCYLIESDEAAVVIDPGEFTPALADFAARTHSKEKCILLTHRHFDHILGTAALKQAWQARIAISKEDAVGLFDPQASMAAYYGLSQTPCRADRLLSDGDNLQIGDLLFRVIATPGHTIGSVSYLCDDCLFSGDTLFQNSMGRYDFPTGDYGMLMDSLQKLAALNGNWNVLPGHGPASTLEIERKQNPYLQVNL